MAEFTKVQMPDGTVLQFPSTMPQADMQAAAANWWSQQSGGAQPAPQAAPMTQDPMLPSPDTDERSTQEFLRDTGQAQPPLIDTSMLTQPTQPTGGGGLMDLARSGLSGLARGATELGALPATIGGGLDALYERTGLIPQGSRENVPSVGGAIRGAASSLTSGGTEYQPQTTGGEYAQTVGEFVGGGAGGRAGVLGGLASEGAGQLTEGKAAEPYARVAGGILGGLAGRPRNIPFTGDDEAVRQANLLRQSGVRNITAGQARQSQPLMRAEGRLAPSAAQLDDFTTASLKRFDDFGSTTNKATPRNLAAIERNIVDQMQDAVQGASIIPNSRHAANAAEVASDYISNVETGLAVGRVKEIAEDIAAASRNSRAVDLDTLKTWRQDIGNLTVSNTPATRRAAHALRRLVDDMTDTTLTQAGRADDITRLSRAREAYRDFIGVRDAATRKGGTRGDLSPSALNQSVIRSQGRENYATGRTTPFADFVRSGEGTLASAPTVNPGGARSISESLPLAGGALAGGGALQAGLDPMTAGLMAVGGVMAPSIGQSAMRSAPIQGLLTNPATTFGKLLMTAPGLLAQ